jgi:acyl carrier protein
MITDIEARVMEIIKYQRRIGEAPISLDTNLMTEKNLDSLELAEIVMDVEDEFRITIPESDYDLFRQSPTPRKIIEYVAKREEVNSAP